MVRINAHAHHHRDVSRDLVEEGIPSTVRVSGGAAADGIQPQHLTQLQEEVAQLSHQVVVMIPPSIPPASAPARHGDDGREAFRLESYVRPFHLAASFDYVASGAYRKEPSLQRFIQARAEQMKEHGQPVELWK